MRCDHDLLGTCQRRAGMDVRRGCRPGMAVFGMELIAVATNLCPVSCSVHAVWADPCRSLGAVAW